MHSFTVWKLADEPNYNTNIDQVFPYSELPHQGEYKLVKIPVSLNDLIKHVDYWGEGRRVSTGGISGFQNCYNVNHQYRLVSSGPDRDKKIPNRIPVLSYTNCDTSVYIKDNSVLTVTVAGAHINSTCAKDITRIVNNDHGKVVVYGVHGDSQEISELVLELRKKGLFPCEDATLPSELQGLTYFDSHVAFFNSSDIRALKDELYNDVIKGNYDSAVNMSRNFVNASVGEAINEIVNKLISSAPRNVMSYAYKLWHGGAKDVVRNHFPHLFQQIINEGAVTIVNKRYQQALKLDSNPDSTNNDRAIWGDKRLAITSGRLSWKFLPSCNSDDLTFQLYNIDCNMFMRMDDAVDYVGDRQCWGSTMNVENSDDDRFKYYLEPVIGNDGALVFLIINVHHKQGLKLEVKQDNLGDRLLWGHNGSIHDVNDRYRYINALNFKMHFFTVWKLADEPNYKTNIDQVFPYSELPHQGEYKLVKIPVSLNDLIKHVDYWGEGRRVSTGGISGFPNCYNVNHQYRLVSSGPDRDKKIPNRIPVLSYTNCDTSVYIKDNSVLTVTVAGAHINSSCAKDIARMVNNDHGKVVVYGVHGDSQEISELVPKLRKKGLFLCKDATLPSELQGLTYFNSHVAFLNSNDLRALKAVLYNDIKGNNNDIRALKDELYNDVIKGNYDSAVNMSRTFISGSVGEAITEIVKKLISSAPRNVMSYAYKLWHGGAKVVVRNHFPHLFQHIINDGAVTIVNKQYQQALKLDSDRNPTNNDKAIWGDIRLAKTSGRLSWKFLLARNSDDLKFQLFNTNCNMFMRMDDAVDYAGDRQCWGSTRNEENSDDDRFKYYLEPIIGSDGALVFLIINVHHKQGLKLEVKQDNLGDRLLWGHNGSIHDVNDRYRWVIAPW